MPYTSKQKGLFGLCSSPEGRKKARKKCPPMAEARKLAHEAAQYHGVYSKEEAARARRNSKYGG